MTLPLAAELGHDHAVGERDSLQRLYARGSIVLTLFASATVSGALVFWPDFFEIWTHGAIPYNAMLAIILLLGMCAGAPAILALSYANYSNRGTLLLWTKSLQLAIFLLLSILLIPPMGPVGAAAALVSSDLIAQFGNPVFHHCERNAAASDSACAVADRGDAGLVTSGGWALGTVIRSSGARDGLMVRFLANAHSG